jgi:micrococcal nuclease
MEMERFIKFFTAAIILFGLAACDQKDESKITTDKSDVTVISATSNAPKNAKEKTIPILAETNQKTQGNICNIRGTSAEGQQFPVIVTETLDGNTIKVIFNGKEETVRYLMVDTPKQKKEGCQQPYAGDASSRNKQLVHSGNVTIEFQFGKNNTDKEGRLLAYVFVNGTSIQETLLKEGLARISGNDQKGYTYSIPFISAQTIAKNNQLNIWSKPDYVTDHGFKQCSQSDF